MSEIYFARLCTLYKWNKDSGYGFSLQATKGKIGHYITEVDRKSPAYAAGLRDDDFVVEVNGINVVAEQHQNVVQKILTDPMKVSLLVIDPYSKSYFETNSIPVSHSMAGVKKIECPLINPFSTDKMTNGHSKSFSEDSQSTNELENKKTGKIDKPAVQSSSRTSSTSVSNSYNTTPDASMQNISPVYVNPVKQERINSVLSSQSTNILRGSNSPKLYDSRYSVDSKKNPDLIEPRPTSVYKGRGRKQVLTSLDFKARAKIFNDL
uniref:PDZ domain-containing protein n=1 Tax=Trichobilharzia regenti TaxID=157069 RepID=A0AA85KD40_TRIRE|nr:unnamed protein product [Trichobilharzia regenti]